MRPPLTRPHPHPRTPGFSLTELMICVGVVGILSAIAIPQITHTDRAARSEVANQVVTSLNRAVTGYRQCGQEITQNANGSSAADETSVMLLLTSRDPGIVGSPFLQGPSWPSVGTDQNDTYRAVWDGRFFSILPPGTEGTGLRLNNL